MFKELAPYLRQRAVLLTVTHVEEDQIRVNVIPQKLREGENAALTTPLTVTASAEELDRDGQGVRCFQERRVVLPSAGNL